MAKLTALPRFARELLASCPDAGAGVHTWLFRAARVLHPFYSDKCELAHVLEAATAGCGREVPEQEIVDAVRNSAARAWKPGAKVGHAVAKSSAWPRYRHAEAEEIFEEISLREYPRTLQSFDRDSLIIRSPVLFADDLYARAILRRLHDGGDPVVCAGASTDTIGTGLLSGWDAGVKMPLPGHRRDSLLFMDDLQFVVPNAMTAEEGIAKHGRKSFRCRDNAARHRRFVVVEFDQAGDEYFQPALHWHLRELAPLAMCVESGGKSIHGWYFVEPQSEEWQMRFFRYAVSIGADPRMWWPEQFSRMPNGVRRNEAGEVVAAQRVIYLDLECLENGKEVSDGEVC